MSQSFYDRVSNSKFYSLGDKLGDIILLSLCWLVCSLPVVTLGSSCTALYYAVHKRFTDHSEKPVHDFFRSFKQNLLQGILITLILLLYAAVTSFNIFVAWKGYNGITLPSWYLPVAVLLILPFIFTATYVFPYLARFKNNVRGTIFHSFTFSTMYPAHTFLMWICILASIALMIFFFPSLLFAPFTCCYICHRLCERDFTYAMILKDKRENPDKYKDETVDGKQKEEDEVLLADITHPVEEPEKAEALEKTGSGKADEEDVDLDDIDLDDIDLDDIDLDDIDLDDLDLDDEDTEEGGTN